MLDNLLKLLDMGEYNCYVWSAYAITFFVFILNAVLTLKEAKAAKQKLKRDNL